jgi:hypothetical protein
MNHAIADLGIPSAESRQTNNSVPRLILIRSRAELRPKVGDGMKG